MNILFKILETIGFLGYMTVVGTLFVAIVLLIIPTLQFLLTL